MREMSEPILWADLDAEPSGGFAAELLGHPLIALAPGSGPDGGNAIRVDYVAFEEGSRRVVVRYPLGASGDEMTLCYAVRFGEDFQFVLGGKLHGVVPDRPVTGGQPPRPDGWSSRVMWRAGGGLETYVYEQDKTGKWGIGRRAAGFRFRRGRWHAISIHTRLNTGPGAHDGFTHVYADGRRVIEHDGLRFRASTEPGTEITHATFCTFHGGNNPLWSPVGRSGERITVHALFSHIAVYQGLRVLRLDR